MDLQSLKDEFTCLLQKTNDAATLNGFLKWIQHNWFTGTNLLLGKYQT